MAIINYSKWPDFECTQCGGHMKAIERPTCGSNSMELKCEDCDYFCGVFKDEAKDFVEGKADSLRVLAIN